MPPARTSLRSFLAAARKALTAPATTHHHQSPLTFVVGNESADLDSLCSALLLAYFRSYAPPNYTLHIPLSNLVRADLALRPELTAVLKHADVQPADLLTLSELPDHLRPDASRWLLVDHNVMTGDLARCFGSRVVGCVDHHQDEGKLGPQVPGEPRVIRTCGSCMSLVVENSRDVWEGGVSAPEGVASLAPDSSSGGSEAGVAPSSHDVTLWDAQLAHVALGPILIDTTNLTSKDKTTPTDIRAVELAEEKIRRAGVTYEQDVYFHQITELKQDLSRLSYRDIFRKDYKEWADGSLVLGTSSVVQSFEYLLETIKDNDTFLSELGKWSDERHLDMAVLFTSFHDDDDGFSRELLVWARGADAVEAAKVFEEKYADDLKLTTWRDGKLDGRQNREADADNWRKCWNQKRTQHSRKAVAPMLRESMKQVLGGTKI